MSKTLGGKGGRADDYKGDDLPMYQILILSFFLFDDDIYYGEVSVCKSVCHVFAYFVGKIIWQMGKLFWKVGKIILEGGKIILAGGKIILSGQVGKSFCQGR